MIITVSGQSTDFSVTQKEKKEKKHKKEQ